MFSWRKIGHIYNPYEESDRPMWRWNFAQGVNTVLFDNFVRVYFCCREKANENGQTISRICFLDLDRTHITHIIRISNRTVMDTG